jgi:hypothetical protein
MAVRELQVDLLASKQRHMVLHLAGIAAEEPVTAENPKVARPCYRSALTRRGDLIFRRRGRNRRTLGSFVETDINFG